MQEHREVGKVALDRGRFRLAFFPQQGRKLVKPVAVRLPSRSGFISRSMALKTVATIIPVFSARPGKTCWVYLTVKSTQAIRAFVASLPSSKSRSSAAAARSASFRLRVLLLLNFGRPVAGSIQAQGQGPPLPNGNYGDFDFITHGDRPRFPSQGPFRGAGRLVNAAAVDFGVSPARGRDRRQNGIR